MGAPQAWDLATRATVAGTRGHIESAFEMAKQEVGLDDCEVRRATGGYRHMTLALWALALLRAVRAADLVPPTKKPAATDSLATFKQARGLATACASPKSGVCGGDWCCRCPGRCPRIRAWSAWRCPHPWQAMCCHYRRQSRQLYNMQL